MRSLWNGNSIRPIGNLSDEARVKKKPHGRTRRIGPTRVQIDSKKAVSPVHPFGNLATTTPLKVVAHGFASLSRDRFARSSEISRKSLGDLVFCVVRVVVVSSLKP